MSRNNRRKKRRKHRRRRHFLLIGILLFGAVLAGSLYLFGFDEVGEKYSGIGLEAENVRSDIQQEAQENHNSIRQESDQNDNRIQNTGEKEPWKLTLVNKENPIPGDYNVNLVEVEGGEHVDERIYEPLMEMLEAAREGNQGELPMVVSGYRTQEKQQSLYDEKVNKFKEEGYSESEAVKQAEQWVAVPGYSEHQLGFAVDINGAVYDVYLWLQENSYKYGFIFRYPGNKTDITGTAEEIWHYRYVGREAAKEIYEKGICLEEYLEDL
ncbi:MAG: M15 family metallopeptidase [Eubacterium sp.]|nr:M15 family metallopeptidase [Eubacterium sp.]